MLESEQQQQLKTGDRSENNVVESLNPKRHSGKNECGLLLYAFLLAEGGSNSRNGCN
jgi:hypothetical protein